jgi:quaternary ammonium compound-resistance protein SugE
MSGWIEQFYAVIDRNAWLLLIAAGIFEILWALTLRLSDGYTKLGPTLATIPLALLSAGLLAMAMRTIPMSVAYTLWLGMGAVGVVALGYFMFREQLTGWHLLCIGLILAGMAGLKLAHHTAG